MTALKADEYRCAMCREVFKFGWTEEEARAEAASKGLNVGGCDLVCDDCYKLTPFYTADQRALEDFIKRVDSVISTGDGK